MAVIMFQIFFNFAARKVVNSYKLYEQDNAPLEFLLE